MFSVTRQTLGSPDFPKNPQKTLFGTFFNGPKKPSRAPEDIEKPSKNPPAAPENVEKPWKNPKKTLPGNIFEGFGTEKVPKGGARASARAPPLVAFEGQNS